MSYILDALKKSERKRPPGPVPDLFTVQGPLPPERHRARKHALTGALVLVALVSVGGWAWLREEEREQVVLPAPTAVQEQASAAAGGAPLPSVPVSSAPPAAVGRTSAGETTAKAPSPKAVPPQGGAPSQPRKSAVPPVPAPAAGRRAPPSASPTPVAQAVPPRRLPSPVVTQRPAAAPAPATAPLPGAAGNGASLPPSMLPVDDADPSQPPPVPAPSPVPGAAPVPEPPVPSLPASVPPPPGGGPVHGFAPPVTSVPASVPTSREGGGTVPTPAAPARPPADNRIVGIEEAPESVRVAIRKVGISGHIWSEDPALRLLTVQNRIVRQGAEAAPGVRVEEITPEGAVLVSEGWRVRVAGF